MVLSAEEGRFTNTHAPARVGGEYMRRKILLVLLGLMTIIVISSSIALAPAGGRKDPLPSQKFIVEIDGIASASFTHVEGVGSDMEVVEYREGNDPYNIVHLTPGLARAGPITLKRGLTENTELWDWFEKNRDESIDRRSMSIVILDHKHEEKARFNFHDCWPSEYYVEPLESSPSGVAIEVIVIQCEIMERA